jgi:hypothetical protein
MQVKFIPFSNEYEYSRDQFLENGFNLNITFPSFQSLYTNSFSNDEYIFQRFRAIFNFGVHAPDSRGGFLERYYGFSVRDLNSGNNNAGINLYGTKKGGFIFPKNPYWTFGEDARDIMITQWKWYAYFQLVGQNSEVFTAYIPAPAARNLNFSFSNAGCSLSWQHPPLFRAKQYIVSFYESDNSLTIGPLKAVRQSITQLNTFFSVSTIPGSFYTAEIASVDYNNQISANTPPVTVRYQVPPTPITNVQLVQNRLNEFNSFTSLSWSGGVSNRTTNTAEFYFATNSACLVRDFSS